MESQIGTSYNLNKQYNFYCTNLSVDKLKNFSYGLPNNAIIISSPTNNKSYDIGTPSILMTDYNSNIMPLTYTLDKSQFSVDEKTNKIVPLISKEQLKTLKPFEAIILKVRLMPIKTTLLPDYQINWSLENKINETFPKRTIKEIKIFNL